MTRSARITALLSAVAITAGSVLAASPSYADAPDPLTVEEFTHTLEEAAETDPVAAESAEDFDELSTGDQQTLVEILNDPAFTEEFLEFAIAQSAASADAALESEVFPDEVTYETDTEIGSPLVGAKVSSGFAAGRTVVYPSYSTQTLKRSASLQILGVTITKLTIWVTFKTGKSGVPKTALSSGSSAINFNVFVNLSNRDLSPYVSSGIAVAKTVWTGSAVIKGSTIRWDRVQTLKAYNAGLYSHTLI